MIANKQAQRRKTDREVLVVFDHQFLLEIPFLSRCGGGVSAFNYCTHRRFRFFAENTLLSPPLHAFSAQARELKLPDFQLRIFCDEWGELDGEATYLLPVHQLPLLWQTVSRNKYLL